MDFFASCQYPPPPRGGGGVKAEPRSAKLCCGGNSVLKISFGAHTDNWRLEARRPPPLGRTRVEKRLWKATRNELVRSNRRAGAKVPFGPRQY